MAQFLFTLAEVTLTVSAVFVPLLLLERKLDRKFAPQWRYWAWLALALRLAVPLNVSLPQAPLTVTVPLAEVRREVPEAWGETAGLPGPSAGGVQGGSAANAGYLPESAADGRPDTASAGTRTPERADGMTILFCLWLTGAAAVLGTHGVSYWSFQRSVRRWRRQELVWKGMPVYRCPKISSPLLMGFFRPCVLLPEGLEGEAVEFALLHEDLHRRRGDLWYKLLLLWGCALHWFNPLVWVLRRTAERDIEISCDGLLLKGRDENYRRSYGAALLTTVTAGRQRGTALTSSFSGSGKSLKQRFRSLVDTSPKAKGRAALAVLCAAALLGGLVACREDSLLDRLQPGASYVVTIEESYGSTTSQSVKEPEQVRTTFQMDLAFTELREGESPSQLQYVLELSPVLKEVLGVDFIEGYPPDRENPGDINYIKFIVADNRQTAEKVAAVPIKEGACTLKVTDSGGREKRFPVQSMEFSDGLYYALGSADFWWNNRDGDGTQLLFRFSGIDPETMTVLYTSDYIFPWPLAEDVLLLHEDGKPFDNFGETGTPLENFLMYPTYMSYYPYIAELVVENGEIVSMTWKKGQMESKTEMIPEIYKDPGGTIIRGDSITIGHGRLIDYDLGKGTITIQEGELSYPSPRELTHLKEEYTTLQLAFPVPTALSIGLYWQGGEQSTARFPANYAKPGRGWGRYGIQRPTGIFKPKIPVLPVNPGPQNYRGGWGSHSPGVDSPHPRGWRAIQALTRESGTAVMPSRSFL